MCLYVYLYRYRYKHTDIDADIDRYTHADIHIQIYSEHTGGREVARTERGARIQGSLGSGIRQGRACAGARGEGREKKGNGSPPASSYHLVVLKLLLLLPMLETLLLLVHVSVIRLQALQDVHVLPHGHFGRILHCLVPANAPPAVS